MFRLNREAQFVQQQGRGRRGGFQWEPWKRFSNAERFRWFCLRFQVSIPVSLAWNALTENINAVNTMKRRKWPSLSLQITRWWLNKWKMNVQLDQIKLIKIRCNLQCKKVTWKICDFMEKLASVAQLCQHSTVSERTVICRKVAYELLACQLLVLKNVSM